MNNTGYNQAKDLLKRKANNEPGKEFVAIHDPEWHGYGLYLVMSREERNKKHPNARVIYQAVTNMDGRLSLSRAAY